MARPLQAHHHLPSSLTIFTISLSSTTTLVLLLAAVAAIVAMVISLCTTNKHSKMSKRSVGSRPMAPDDRRRLLSTLSGIGSKALVVAKMVSWKRSDDSSDDELSGVGDADGEALWKKSILMGEKCRPLDFSGQIEYDSAGNQLPEFAKPAKGSSDKNGVS